MGKMKLNWGTGIAIFYTAFCVAILVFVFWSTQYTPDLVTEDYYSEEMEYQSKINGKQRVRSLEGEVRIKTNERETKVILPSKLENKKIKGNLHLYRPADKSLDKKFDFSGNDILYSFNSGKLKKGNWKAKLSWVAEGKEYYYEETLWIQ